MVNYHHKAIKKFSLEGNILDDALIGRLRWEYVKLINSEMVLSGYVPRLDIDPDFTIQYNEQHKYFEFTLSIYGVYVGKKKSEWILGIDGVTAIPIQTNKLNEFSQDQA